MKIVLKAKGQKILVMWVGNDYPFVVANASSSTKVGDVVNEWHWGKYFQTLDEALECFNKEIE